MAFAETLKQLREARRLTQEQLAEKLSISRSSISMYERGEREPDFETLEVIADFFNVDMNKLIGKAPVSEFLMTNPYIEKYNELNDNNKKTVNNLIDDLHEQQTELEQLRQEAKKQAANQSMLAAFGGNNKIHISDDDELARIDRIKKEFNK